VLFGGRCNYFNTYAAFASSSISIFSIISLRQSASASISIFTFSQRRNSDTAFASLLDFNFLRLGCGRRLRAGRSRDLWDLPSPRVRSGSIPRVRSGSIPRVRSGSIRIEPLRKKFKIFDRVRRGLTPRPIIVLSGAAHRGSLPTGARPHKGDQEDGKFFPYRKHIPRSSPRGCNGFPESRGR
jgi:hypothetical protein